MEIFFIQIMKYERLSYAVDAYLNMEMKFHNNASCESRQPITQMARLWLVEMKESMTTLQYGCITTLKTK